MQLSYQYKADQIALAEKQLQRVCHSMDHENLPAPVTAHERVDCKACTLLLTVDQLLKDVSKGCAANSGSSSQPNYT